MVQTMQYCGGFAVGTWLVFLGPCTQVHGQGFSRYQGGEGVAGTPGACSQVFCHPTRCIALAYMDRHIRQTHRQNHHHHHHHPRIKPGVAFLLLWPVCLLLQWAP